MKETLTEVANTLLEKSVTIEVDILNPGWFEKFLIKRGWKKPKRTFIIKPLCLGSLIKISKLILEIDVSIIGEKNYQEVGYKLMKGYSHVLAEIVAIAIINAKTDPPKELTSFLLHNLSAKELLSISMLVLKQLDTSSFIASIISIRGVNILQAGMSLKPGEIIASGQPLEE
jgi:hypothetical protein